MWSPECQVRDPGDGGSEIVMAANVGTRGHKQPADTGENSESSAKVVVSSDSRNGGVSTVGTGHSTAQYQATLLCLLPAMVDISAVSCLMQSCLHCPRCPGPAQICSDPFSPLLHGMLSCYCDNCNRFQPGFADQGVYWQRL